MNSKQRMSMVAAWNKADALEPGKHEITRRSSPAMESLRCSCGWSAAEHRNQNALGRESKLDKKIRAHALEIINRHQVTV
jgi:hypothetical protein